MATDQAGPVAFWMFAALDTRRHIDVERGWSMG